MRNGQNQAQVIPERCPRAPDAVFRGHADPAALSEQTERALTAAREVPAMAAGLFAAAAPGAPSCEWGTRTVTTAHGHSKPPAHPIQGQWGTPGGRSPKCRPCLSVAHPGRRIPIPDPPRSSPPSQTECRKDVTNILLIKNKQTNKQTTTNEQTDTIRPWVHPRVQVKVH